MKLSDFRGLFKKLEATIESIENPYGDYYSIKLKFPSDANWIAGEHGIFTLPSNKVEGKKWRAFSIASTYKEGVMMIGTRTGENISGFKKELIGMKTGDKVSIRGPFGWFKLQDDVSPLVMFASGVGVTPIRALLKELENSSRNINVVYASNDFYLYGEEIEAIASNNPNITLHKVEKRKEVSESIEKLGKKYGNKAYYYNSGSPKAIKSVKTQLKNLGVKGSRVIDDSFLGY